MNADQASAFLKSLDEEQINRVVTKVVDEFIVPRAEEVKQEAQDNPSSEEVREQLESLPKEKKDRIFNDTVADLVLLAGEIRERPADAAPRVRDVVRDPHTLESLLLVFDEEGKVDPEYAGDIKDYATTQVRWVSVHLAPELYTQEELLEVTSKLYPDTAEAEVKQHLREKGIEIE